MAAILMIAYTSYERDPRVRRQAEALVEAGHRVVFLARAQAGGPGRRTVAGVELIELGGLRHDRLSARGYVLDYVIFLLLAFAHLLVRPTRYGLVHVNNMPDFLVFAALPARVFGRPVIHDVHDLMPELYQEKFGVGDRGWMVWALRLQERWSARFASAVLTVEERLREILATRGVRKHKISVLMNLPDERVFKADPDRRVLKDGGHFTLVYHGTLARRLGLDVALEAVSRLRAEIPGLQLRIIGAGEERDRLIELRDHLELGQVVTFSDGFVPLDSVPALLADADVGLVPLRASPGTDIMLPTKLLEYVSLGIPCVVPRTGTICRYFDVEMVQFFEAGDPASLAEAILALYRDPARRAMLAEAASTRFIARYKWSEHKRVYVDLVERLLAA